MEIVMKTIAVRFHETLAGNRSYIAAANKPMKRAPYVPARCKSRAPVGEGLGDDVVVGIVGSIGDSGCDGYCRLRRNDKAAIK